VVGRRGRHEGNALTGRSTPEAGNTITIGLAVGKALSLIDAAKRRAVGRLPAGRDQGVIAVARRLLLGHAVVVGDVATEAVSAVVVHIATLSAGVGATCEVDARRANHVDGAVALPIAHRRMRCAAPSALATLV